MRRDMLIWMVAMTIVGAPAAAQSSPVALATGASPVSRPDPDTRTTLPLFISRALIEQDYRHDLARLRKAALKQKAADGGELTLASIADLQGRLEKLNMTRQRDLKLLERS